MTLEETTEQILAAAEAEDLEALENAHRMREEAMAALMSLEPTEALRDRVAASLAAGEKARRAIHQIKLRIRTESRRLATIEAGFVRCLLPSDKPHIDFKG